MILIDFFDEDLINTLVPVKTLQPDKVYFLLDRKKENDREIKAVAEAIYAWGYVKEIYYYPVDIYNMQDIQERLAEIWETAGDEKVYMEFSGGSELMIAAGFDACRKNKAVATYVDIPGERMINMQTGEELMKVIHISLDDYFRAIGAKRLDDSRALPRPVEYERICKMAESIFTRITDWHALQDYLSKHISYEGWYNSFKVPERLTYNGKHINSTFLMSKFRDYGFVEETEHGVYRFLDARYQQYMVNYGIWLEMYIYIKALDFFDEAYLGVVIDWKSDKSVDTQDNEIDVLVMRKSMPIFISCKMKKPGNYDVYEVGYLASRLGGENARSIMATTYEIGREDPWGTGIYGRLNKMNVGLIEVGNLVKKDPKKVWERALKYIH